MPIVAARPVESALICSTSVSAKRAPLNSTVQGPPGASADADVAGAEVGEARQRFFDFQRVGARRGCSAVVAVEGEGLGVAKVNLKEPAAPRVDADGLSLVGGHVAGSFGDDQVGAGLAFGRRLGEGDRPRSHRDDLGPRRDAFAFDLAADFEALPWS